MATILNSPSLSPAPVVDYAALRQLDLERQALDHEKMFLETDAYITGLPQEQQAALNSYLEWAPDPESSKRKSVNRGYIGDFYGLPDEALGEGGYQTYRDRYAREVLGVPQGGELNDDSFFELMKEKQQKQKDFREIADYFTNDAAKSASVMKEADRFAETARIKKDTQAFPNMTKEDGDRLAEHWVDRRMAFEERFGPLRPQAREIYDMLAKGKLERFGEESQASIEGAIDRLTMLSPDDRAIVVAMLKNEGGTDTSGNTVEKVAGAAIRGFTGQLRGMMNSDEIGKILEYRQALEKGDVRLSAAMPTDPVELEKRFAEGLRGGDPTMFDTRVGISGQPRSERKATPEQIAKFKELTDAAIARSDTAAQAIGILEGTIDPIKTDKALNDGLLASTGTYAQRTAIDLGYSIGAMATIAIPYAGIIIAQGGYADQEYQKLREEGNDPETSYRASQFTGAMQAGFERTAFLFNFVPSSAVAQFTATRAGSKVMGVRPSLETSTAFQVLSKMGTIQAAQYGEEIAQASAPILTAFVGEKLGWNLAEQSKFQGEIQQFKEEGGFWRPEVFSTVMGLSVFGGGLSGISDSQQAQAGLAALLRDQTKIEAMGIAPAKAAEIVKTVGVEERKQAYIDAYAERDVQSPSAVAAQKLVTAQVDAQKAQGAAELLAMKNAGLDITRTADGWAVTDTTEPDAEPIPHATAEEAMTTVRSVIKARGMQREETFLDALSDYASIMEPGRTVRLSNKTGTLFEDLTEAIKEGRELSIESIWDRANQVRKKEGQAPLEQDINNPESAEALSGMFVLGRSFNEVQGNVVNKVSMIMRGGGTVDLVEEQAENDLSRSVASGRTTYDVVREVVKSLQKVTGDTYMFSDTTRGITEAWSTLVTLYTTGKARGNRITSGTRRELLAGLREARGDLPANYRAERQRLKAAEASGVAPSAFAKLRAYFDYLKSIMGHAAKIANAQADLEAFRDTLGQVARLKKAAKEGALGDLEALIRESVGLKEKDAFDSALADKVEDMMQPPDDGTGYSVKTLTKGEIARKEAAAAKAAAEKAAEELATATRIASVLNGVGQPTGPLVAANDVADAKQVPAMIPSKYVGKRFFLAMADLLGASGSVRGVPMQGGAGYPLMNYDPAEPTKTTAAWASTRDGVAALLRDMVKTNVIWKDEKDGKHYALLAPNAMDQETHKSNLNAGIVFVADMAHAVETGVINKEDNEKLLANIRSKNSTLAAFPGFTDPSALGFFGNLSFENRVVVFNAMQTAEALAAGAPVSNVMLLTTRDESYHGVELGSMLSMLLIDIDRMATQVDGKWVLRDDLSAADFNVPPHLSYDTIIPGRMIAHFRTPIPLDVAIPGMITEFKAASDAVNAEKIKKGEKPGTMGRPAFLLTRMPKGINGQLLTEELFADIESVQGLGKMGIHPPAIRALTDAVEGTWLTVNTKKAAGLKEFLKAQARSEARNTLKIYSEKELIELVKAGTVELYALGKEVAERDVAFAIHKMPDGTKELRSAINNTGVKGMLPLIVARAIEAGANRTEVFAVPTAANPNGVLVEAFEKHGWTAPKDKEGNRIVVPYDRNKLGTTEAERAHKEAALKDYWTSQGWDGQKMPDRVILSHGGIRTETIDDPTGLSLAERKTTGARSTPDETAAQIRGAVGDGIQENVPTGGSAGGTVAGRGRVLPRGTDTTVQTLESANLTPAQLRTLGLTSARFEALKATAAQGAGYSITTRQKASLKMQMTRDEILDAIDKSKDWKDFYTTYQYLLDEYFGDDATAFQSILSITSQAASVKANVAIALRMYGYWKRGEEFDGKKRGEAESGALSGVLKNLERWRDDVALSGRKISNYQAANEGKEGATEKVVVDRHIANMLFGTKTPTDAQFTEAEKVLTEIAQSIGWEPRQVQAALWAASIRKSGTEPASYDQYLKTLRERGTIYERTGATPGAGGIFAEGVERPIRRPVARRGAGKTGTDGYSITTAAGLENIKAQLDKVAIDPDVRFNMMQRASENLAKMVRDIGFRDDVTAAANDAGMALMEQQQATAMAGVVDRYSAEEQQRLIADEEALKELKAKHETALQDLSVKADIEAGGAQADGWTADQKDALKVRQRLEQTTLQARQRAETLALETKQQKATDAAKAKERQEVNLLKQEQAAQRKANEQKTGAREQRATMLDYLAALDTILMPFPAEVRNKVGGFVSLAGLRTNAAMNKYLKDRVEKLNKVLETYMRKEYTIAMERLLKKAEPTKGKPGEKMAGKLGPDVQHLMDMVRTSLKWTAEEVNAHIAGLQTTIDGGTLTAEQEVLALREIELVQLAGDWTHADAAKRSAAVQAATETYEGGYLAWKAKLIAKREAREKIKTALITDTGKAGTQTERDERAKKDLGWMGKAKDFWLSLSSFEELTRYVFGEKSEAATEMVDRERAAAYQYEDATTAMGDLVQQHFNDLAGGHLKGEQLRFRLSQKTINTPSASLSELEAIQAILLWNQEDGKRHMIGTLDENNKPTGAWHYNQDWVDSVMAQMTPEGKATMAFIQRIYAEEWATLNPLYRERHGVNLPRHENYAPITVAPVQAKGGEMVDPVSGAAMTGSILTPGSLRTRSRRAIAEPEFRDALQTMLAHTKQMEHWKAYYDFAVDAQAILGNRDVGNAVQAAAGKEGKMVLRKWLDIFSQGGSRDAGAALAGNRLLSTMSGRAARMALVGRVGTLLIQSTQLAAASAEMPVGAYVSRLGRLLSGNLGWKNAIRSEFIQRRIQQAPPIVRQAMEGMTSDRPNVVRQAANYLGTLISGADGLFTSGTYAILLDYHMAQAAKLNITGPEAADYANRQAERITERVAQPTRMGTRSLFENTQTSPLAKLGWAFASEARQKIALAAWAARNAKADPARAARVAFLTWVVGGLMAQVIRNAWKDLKDDDDDTLFDDRNWNLKQMVASTLSGPLQGIPGLGSAFQSVISNTAGTYNQQGNLLDGFGKSVPALKGLISGESMEDAEPVEEIMKDVEAILTAAGMVNETAASATSLFHLVRDGSSVLDGLQDDAEELKAKAKAADRREAAERKKQRMEQGAQ